MDHKLAIVLVPRDSADPVQASRVLLERHQKAYLDSAGNQMQPRFRYKRVGGWFDGLARGQVGQERWSTVLTMLLNGAESNSASPFPGFAPETTGQIESRIESDNTVELDDLSPLAPCSIVVTVSGEWIAHPHPDHLDENATSTYCKEEEAWRQVKLALFQQNRGATAVAWDLSWDFIAPVTLQVPRPRMPRAWGSKSSVPATPSLGLRNRAKTFVLGTLSPNRGGLACYEDDVLIVPAALFDTDASKFEDLTPWE